MLASMRGFRKYLFQLSNQSCSQNFMLQRLRPNIREATPSINNDLSWKNEKQFWKMAFRPLLTSMRGFRKYLYQLSNQSRSQNFIFSFFPIMSTFMLRLAALSFGQDLFNIKFWELLWFESWYKHFQKPFINVNNGRKALFQNQFPFFHNRSLFMLGGDYFNIGAQSLQYKILRTALIWKLKQTFSEASYWC